MKNPVDMVKYKFFCQTKWCKKCWHVLFCWTQWVDHPYIVTLYPTWLKCFSITKGSIYYIKHKCVHVQCFSMEVDWLKIWCLMQVSTMFYTCTYCIFNLWGRYSIQNTLTWESTAWGDYSVLFCWGAQLQSKIALM